MGQIVFAHRGLEVGEMLVVGLGLGGLLFPALGVLYLVAFWGRFHWSAYAILSGSLFLLGGLFLLNWQHRAELRPPA